MGRQVEQLRDGGQIVCGTPGRVLDHLRRGTLQLDRVRAAVLDECDEMLSMGFQEDIEKILEETPADAADAALLGDGARGHPAHLAALPAQPRVPQALGRLHRRPRDQAPLLLDPGRAARERAAAHPRVRGSEVGHHLLQHARGDGARRRVPAQERARRRGDLVGPRAERSRARARAHARGRHQVPRRDRRRGARHRHRGALARVQLHVPRVARDLRPPHGPHGPRGQERHGRVAHRADRGRVVLLPQAPLQDPAGRARPAFGNRDPLAPRGRARRRCCAPRSRPIPGDEWRGLARRLTSAVDGERLIAALLAKSFKDVENMPVAPKPPAPVARRGAHRSRPSASDRVAATATGRATATATGRATATARARRPRSTAPRDARRGPEPARSRASAASGARRAARRRARRGAPRRRGSACDARRAARGRAAAHRRRAPSTAPSRDARRRASPETPAATAGGPRDDRGPARAAAPSAAAPRRCATTPPPPRRSSGKCGARSASQGEAPAGAPDAAAPSASSRGRSRGRRERGPRDRAAARRGPSDELPPGTARLYLNLGRKDGASERDVADLLASHVSLDDARPCSTS